MVNKNGVNIRVALDQKALNYFQRKAPQRLIEAREKAVHAMGMVWADETKDLTRAENHIDTGLYINSIGYSTGSPSSPFYEMQQDRNQHTLLIGADVAYAESLEKRFGLMARGLDISKSRMKKVAEAQVRKSLEL